MSDEIVLPQRMTTFGQALIPLEASLRAALNQRLAPTAPVVSMVDVARQHLDILSSVMQRLTHQCDALMAEVVSNESATDGDVYRAAGRLEGVLDGIRSGYFDVQRLAAQGSDIEARDLLAGAYRHALREILAWISDIVWTMANPGPALQAKGLPSEGNIEIRLSLTLTAAPELEELGRWVGRQAKIFSLHVEQVSGKASSWGIWPTVLALVGLWLFVKILF